MKSLTSQFPTASQPQKAIPLAHVLQDSVFLAVIVLLSVVLYVGELGFYSDDWTFLSLLHNSSDQSIFGLCRALFTGNMQMRPAQIFQLAVLYRMFGLQPIGYHLANVLVSAFMAVLFYLTLREFKQPRMLALSLPTVFILLPHYSTDRFWVAAFSASLSIVFYFFSLFSDLRALGAVGRRFWLWKLLSIVNLTVSCLAYEVALPLFLFNIVLVWIFGRSERTMQSDSRKSGRALFWTGNLVALLLVAVFKAAITERAGITNGYLHHSLYIFESAVRVNYVAYGRALPQVTWKVLRYHSTPTILIMGILLGTLIFAYLYRVMRTARGSWPTPGFWVKMIALSILVFVLGYAIFLTTSQVQFHKTGIANRIAIAGALGVAMSMVGGCGLLSTVFSSPRLRSLFLSLCVALLSMSGFWIINSIATYWKAAYQQEKRILADINVHVPVLSSGNILLLDGVCPYFGPVPVFESFWDLAGALQVQHKDLTIGSDVIKPKTEVTEDGLVIPIYGFRKSYPYSENLLIYHYGNKRLYSLGSFEEARTYFQSTSPTRNSECPKGAEGYGVAIF